MLANGLHLFAIGSVAGGPSDLIAHGRAPAASLGGLVQGGTHRLRVVEPLGTQHVERRGSCIVEAHVKGSSHA